VILSMAATPLKAHFQAYSMVSATNAAVGLP
jgi:hypothetical protein